MVWLQRLPKTELQVGMLKLKPHHRLLNVYCCCFIVSFAISLTSWSSHTRHTPSSPIYNMSTSSAKKKFYKCIYIYIYIYRRRESLHDAVNVPQCAYIISGQHHHHHHLCLGIAIRCRQQRQHHQKYYFIMYYNAKYYVFVKSSQQQQPNNITIHNVDVYPLRSIQQHKLKTFANLCIAHSVK